MHEVIHGALAKCHIVVVYTLGWKRADTVHITPSGTVVSGSVEAHGAEKWYSL